jgi:hypothetical protein
VKYLGFHLCQGISGEHVPHVLSVLVSGPLVLSGTGLYIGHNELSCQQPDSQSSAHLADLWTRLCGSYLGVGIGICVDAKGWLKFSSLAIH